MVGVDGFEPSASRPQTARSARLSYTPWLLLTVCRATCSRNRPRLWVADSLNPMNTPKIPASAVVMRVIGILGMGLSFSATVLLIVAAEWTLAGISAAAFLPFVATMYFVDRLWLAERRPDA